MLYTISVIFIFIFLATNDFASTVTTLTTHSATDMMPLTDEPPSSTPLSSPRPTEPRVSKRLTFPADTPFSDHDGLQAHRSHTTVQICVPPKYSSLGVASTLAVLSSSEPRPALQMIARPYLLANNFCSAPTSVCM